MVNIENNNMHIICIAYLIESARSYDLYLAPMNHVRRTPFKVQYLPAKNGVRFKHLNNINFHSLFMRSISLNQVG